jgi:group I intron endonuclease
MQGVYIIKNKITKTVYVGSTENTKIRWRDHRRHLKQNVHANIYLQRSWNKNTPEDFEFILVQLVENPDHLFAYEQSYIDFYARQPAKIYNMCPAAGSNRGFTKFSSDKEKKLARQNSYRKYKQSPKAQEKLLANKSARQEYHKAYQATPKHKERRKQLEATPKYKQIFKEYNSSPAGKDRQKRYNNSEKGRQKKRERDKRYRARRLLREKAEATSS